MTELETRLMDALAALSAQWDAEQQQHADEQDMLNVRIDDLTQLVQDFAGQHETASRRLAGAATAARHAGRALDDAVRQHRSGLQGARRRVAAGLNRIRQHIAQRQQARDGPSR